MSAFLVNKDDSDALEIPALPLTLFISEDGTFSGYHIGAAPWDDAEFSVKVRQHLKIN